jgi:hypothetical protein
MPTNEITRPLPSQSSAHALLAGDWSAAPLVALHWLGRAGIIACGMAAVGERNTRTLVAGSLAGSAAVELFVLLHELTSRPAQPTTMDPNNVPR